ncbi:hypothetical protein PFISCL1PPCAC_24535 [Pristionchus fissidentatus]|uniref:G protein-coupled receptor n=1 Tax=Pristionchus fissidentatus TaxID=1538716 RepID=A0AAV5WSK1_9BILA|nr:hypothetical protein PFISCL1PPCAC_24535 [Pristionchus fissidentatus]
MQPQPMTDYPRQNLQHLQPTQSMQQQSQVQTHNNGRYEASSALPISSNHHNQHNFYPAQQMQSMTTTNPAAHHGLQLLQLPHDWKPYGCCGISNETWTQVILYSLLILSIIDIVFTLREGADLIVKFDLYLFLSAIYYLATNILLLVSSSNALIHIQKRKTSGLSFFLGVLFLFYIFEWINLVFEIIVEWFPLNDGQPSKMDATKRLVYYFYRVTLTIFSLVLIRIMRKVLFDFRATMRLNGAK